MSRQIGYGRAGDDPFSVLLKRKYDTVGRDFCNPAPAGVEVDPAQEMHFLATAAAFFGAKVELERIVPRRVCQADDGENLVFSVVGNKIDGETGYQSVEQRFRSDGPRSLEV